MAAFKIQIKNVYLYLYLYLSIQSFRRLCGRDFLVFWHCCAVLCIYNTILNTYCDKLADVHVYACASAHIESYQLV